MPAPSVIHAEALDDNVIIFFNDGSSAMYSNCLLDALMDSLGRETDISKETVNLLDRWTHKA